MRLKNLYRKCQDFIIKKDNVMMDYVDKLLQSVSLKTLRKYINNSILFSHAYQGGNVGDDLLNTIKKLKQIQKRHR